MKGGLVAMLVAAVIHRELGGGGRIKLVFVPDEETDGVNGSERLEELGVIDPTATSAGAIVAEPSFPNIWYAARAAFTVEVTVEGRLAHVGLLYTGSNALLAAHNVLDDLFAMADAVAQHRTEPRIEPEPARQSIMLIGGTSGGGTNFDRAS
jgi:acetylornithine deacetylase/succinyl-diaminopimelate desuccinylase-like protein